MRVDSIRNKEDIERMEHALRYISYRDYMIFKTGINSALRISDLMKLKVSKVRKRIFGIHEQKTGKYRQIFINDHFKPVLWDYMKYMRDDDYLFRTMRSNELPSYFPFYHHLKKAGAYCELDINIGTHTCRKTFGYWHYQQFKDIAILMELLNHSNERETLIYIGVIQEEINRTLADFYI